MSPQVIEEWLAQKGVQQWADWNISDPEQRTAAASWLLSQMHSLERFRAAKAREHVAAFAKAPGYLVDVRPDTITRNLRDFDVVCGGESHLVRGTE